MRSSWLLSLACIVMVGCDAAVGPMSTLATDVQDTQAAIAAAGFDTTGWQDHGSYVRVEGDILLSKADLLGRPDVSAQWRSTNLVSQSNARAIRVNLDGLNAYPSWRNAAIDAMDVWSNVPGTALQLSEGSPAHIYVSTTYENDDWVASASFPSNGLPGGVIVVNTKYIGIPSGQQVAAMVHELGHTIGFRHTDWDSRTPKEPKNPIGAVLIPWTPMTDSYSIMNRFLPYTWLGLSNYDEVAVVELYPDEPTLQVQLGPSGASVSWSPVTGAVSYKLQREVYGTYRIPEEDYQWEYTGGDVVDVYAGSDTTYFDAGAPYTGKSWCYRRIYNDYLLYGRSQFRLIAYFPNHRTVTTEFADFCVDSF